MADSNALARNGGGGEKHHNGGNNSDSISISSGEKPDRNAIVPQSDHPVDVESAKAEFEALRRSLSRASSLHRVSTGQKSVEDAYHEDDFDLMDYLVSVLIDCWFSTYGSLAFLLPSAALSLPSTYTRTLGRK